MASTLQKLYASREKYGDMAFVVESEKIRVHRCILAATSKTLEDYLNGLDSREEEIKLPYVSSASAFKEFTKFCYLHEMNLSIFEVEAVRLIAKSWGVTECVTETDSFLERHLNPTSNIFWTHRLALIHKWIRVEQVCEFKIIQNTSEVFACDTFRECTRLMLLQILYLDSLNCTEIEVINACISWTKFQYEAEVEPKKLRAAMNDLIHRIRFRSMTVEEFYCLNKEYEGFFTPLECIEITAIILGQEGDLGSKFSKKTRTRPNVTAGVSRVEDSARFRKLQTALKRL